MIFNDPVYVNSYVAQAISCLYSEWYVINVILYHSNISIRKIEKKNQVDLDERRKIQY